MAPLPLRFVYHPGYHLNLGDHVFPSVKFARIAEALAAEGLRGEANTLVPEPARREDLLLVHTPAWTAALLDGSIRYEQVLRLEIPYSKPMVDGFLLHTGGSIAAAQAALDQGAAFNIGGGFHHAFPNHGEGFCAVHDVAVALRYWQRQGRIRSALVIDTDVHHGNGTAAIFAQDPSVFTLSIHQENNYPALKPPSDLDVPIADGADDEAYLSALHGALDECFSRFAPDLIAYVAGSDPFVHDKLGGLNLTMAGMYQRDLMVFEKAFSRRIPIFVTLAGGYAADLNDTVSLHANTAKACAAAGIR